jgi:hypothetical protein
MFSPTIRPESYSRGDKTAIERFVASINGWDGRLRRSINLQKSFSA